MRTGNWWAVVAVVGLVSGSVFGAGFQLYTEGSAEALGQAGAISGRTNLVSLAWYNPSALAGTDRPAIMVGSTFVQINTDFTSPAGDASMSDDWRVVPHLYYVQPLAENLTGMLSINAPYGLITEWPADWAGAQLAVYSDLKTVYITPSVAYRVMDKLAVSAGVNVVDAEAELTRTGAVVKGQDMSYGYTFSGHYEVLDGWALGARYQSRVELGLEGTLTVGPTFPATADITLPSSVNIGIANTSINNLSLGVDVIWTEWSTYDYLTVVAPPVPTDPSPKQWDDVWSIRVGGEYALKESWALRAGYVWDQSPVPDTTRSPELPGSDRQMLMGGVGWKGEHIGIDVAYSYLWADTAKMGTDPAANPIGLDGEFDTTTHLISLSVSYAF